LQPIFVDFIYKIAWNMYLCNFIHRTDSLAAGSQWAAQSGKLALGFAVHLPCVPNVHPFIF